MAVSVIAIRLIPVLGQGRAGASGWDLLHFLWIYAVLYIVAMILERVDRRKAGLKGVAQNFFEGAGIFLALTVMYFVFFEHAAGAAIAAALSVIMYVVTRPVVKAMEWATGEDTWL